MDLSAVTRDTVKLLSDDEIIKRVVEGDIDVFAVLLTRHKNHVAQIVSRHVPHDTVEETAHNVFIRAYRSLPTYRGKERFVQWISSIAVRTCHDFWRERYRNRDIAMSSLSEKHQELLENVITYASDETFQSRAEQQEAKEVLDWALEKLPAADRMVVELVFLEGLSVGEAAGLLGLSTANVKVRSFRARRKLRKLLSEFMKEGKDI